LRRSFRLAGWLAKPTFIRMTEQKERRAVSVENIGKYTEVIMSYEVFNFTIAGFPRVQAHTLRNMHRNKNPSTCTCTDRYACMQKSWNIIGGLDGSSLEHFQCVC
jgi:hypothetical protein